MPDAGTRRRYQRVHADMTARISTIEPDRDPWTGRPYFRASHETCANVSRGGAFVQTEEPLDPGRRILIELELPNGKPVEAIGRVAWAKRVIVPGADSKLVSVSGIGVEFLGASAEQFSALEDYIEQRSGPPPVART